MDLYLCYCFHIRMPNIYHIDKYKDYLVEKEGRRCAVIYGESTSLEYHLRDGRSFNVITSTLTKLNDKIERLRKEVGFD